MVMMILFTAIKILSFYGKQNRNALQHKKKCIDSKYALFALRNRCAISTLKTMSISVVAMKTLQSTTGYVYNLIDDNKITASQKTLITLYQLIQI